MERKEAIEIVRKLYNESLFLKKDKEAMVTLIPELKESEGERTRKYIINHLQEHLKTVREFLNNGMPAPFSSEEIKMLEASVAWLEKQGELKPVPKFKIGDTMRTLQEAKDGFTDGMPVVVSIDEEYYHCTNEKIAIKDQDDYEYPPMNRRQKTIGWSEEDEKRLSDIIVFVSGYATKEVNKEWVDFLKSLKERVQPKQEWSDEDNEHIKSIISTIECSKAQFPNAQAVLEAYNSDLIWLKSLRPQSHWRPSEKQLYILNWAANILLSEKGIVEIDASKTLDSLYNDLKKLNDK